MLDWGYWIGPLIAVVLALRLRPSYLIVLGIAAFVGFWISFGISVQLYDRCDPCSSRAESLFWVNTILFTLWPALLLLGVAKAFVNAWLQRHRTGVNFSAGPS